MRKKEIKTKHGIINTPAFMPDATYGSIRNVNFRDAKKAGVEEIVTTTLHIENKIGSEYVREFGGIHKFFGWDRPILTDSGGFQVFSLIHAAKDKSLSKITDAGCSFVNPENGQTKFLSPEISQIIQHNLGSDIRTALDEPTVRDAPRSILKDSLRRNTRWAKRSKEKFLELHDLTQGDFENSEIERPLLGAVIQGGNNFNLRKQSTEELIEIGFDIYNFGGMPLHNQKSWRNNAAKGFHHELLAKVAELIPEDKIRYAMGVGTPDDIAFCVNNGWDIFDTVLPTRNARHGYLYVTKGQGDAELRTYDVLHLKSKRYKFDDRPIDEHCDCEACQTVTRAYLRHLIRINEPAGYRLATIHNLRFYNQVMDNIVRPTDFDS
ncbi:tRNA guanosine(34) transglycosylase Tgt [Candidatus Dojkabacteria bacterium]|nr:tRNA guanosine(34) transglycosylase Tgt [Candidatus Dojkabacteria bacterium]